MPVDGAPIIGRPAGFRGAHLAVMHAGVTPAPTIGRLVAEELVHERCVVDLEGSRPDRSTR